METARASGRPVGGSAGAGLDVDLEQLPAYEEVRGGAGAPVQVQRPIPVAPDGAHRAAPAANNGVVGLGSASLSAAVAAETPDEPPPGYDDVVQGNVADDLKGRAEKK